MFKSDKLKYLITLIDHSCLYYHVLTIKKTVKPSQWVFKHKIFNVKNVGSIIATQVEKSGIFRVMAWRTMRKLQQSQVFYDSPLCRFLFTFFSGFFFSSFFLESMPVQNEWGACTSSRSYNL
jgi:hypothetical protein